MASLQNIKGVVKFIDNSLFYSPFVKREYVKKRPDRFNKPVRPFILKDRFPLSIACPRFQESLTREL
jgi:hypothetical protein